MKVICIDDNFNPNLPHPNFLDIDDVVACPKGNDGVYLFVLERFGENIGYNQKNFSLLSDINETELIKERELVNGE